ncbi:MAG: hypothetical protein Kow0049_17110 [Stanieria sp.]
MNAIPNTNNLQLSISDTLTGGLGELITVPISINDATGLQSLTLTLNYDTNLLDIIDPNLNTDNNEAVKRTGVAANWKLISGEGSNPNAELPNPIANVNDATGEVTISLINPGTVPTTGSGNILTIDFTISSNAVPNSSSVIDLKTAKLGINNQEINLGDSNLDDGKLTLSKGSAVYRFYNTNLGVHFYTTSEVEKQFVLDKLPQYRFEGASYTSAAQPNAGADPLTGAKPVYRFYNNNTGVHLYTSSEKEKNFIQNDLGAIYRFENTAYYAYNNPTDGTIPIYRFYNTNLDVHFFTPSAVEKDFVIDNLPQYRQEGIGGIAFYAYEYIPDSSI